MARKSLLAFTNYTFPQYTVASPHQRIATALEAVERGEIKRLMISVPPRGGKSELVSRRFPAWVLGRNPDFEIIASSYSGELATDFGREVREIVKEAEYEKLFPGCRISAISGAMDQWQTTNGGKYRAVGVEGSATGRGAMGFIIDDPVKDRQEADSETRQRRTWDWYRSTAYTRLSKDGWIIVCQTRWNDEDLSGKLLDLESKGGERWHQIIIPAIDDGGESFWPERFPIDRLDTIKSTLGPREWSALYMQKPQPISGTFFQRCWFDGGKDTSGQVHPVARYETKPANLHIYITSDHARSDEAGDYTVLRVWGVDTKADLYWLGGWRGRTTPDIWMGHAVGLIKTWKPLCWFAENDTIFGSVEPFMKRAMRDAGVACRIEKLPTRGDKVAKAQSFQGMAAQGRVHLPWTPEADEAIDEYLRFPTGKNDDEVDAGANMGRALMDAHPAIVQSKPQEVRRDPWGNPLKDESDDWRTA